MASLAGSLRQTPTGEVYESGAFEWLSEIDLHIGETIEPPLVEVASTLAAPSRALPRRSSQERDLGRAHA